MRRLRIDDLFKKKRINHPPRTMYQKIAVKPKKLTKDERDIIIAQFQLGPVTLFTIARNQEMRIQNIEDQIELYNRAVFQDLNDRLESITLEFQKLKTNKGDCTNTNKIEEDNEDSS